MRINNENDIFLNLSVSLSLREKTQRSSEVIQWQEASMGHEISKPPGKLSPEQIAGLTDAQKHYMKKSEGYNINRVNDLRYRRARSRVLGISLGAMAFGICILEGYVR